MINQSDKLGKKKSSRYHPFKQEFVKHQFQI
jgi:hypothetical protein